MVFVFVFGFFPLPLPRRFGERAATTAVFVRTAGIFGNGNGHLPPRTRSSRKTIVHRFPRVSDRRPRRSIEDFTNPKRFSPSPPCYNRQCTRRHVKRTDPRETDRQTVTAFVPQARRRTAPSLGENALGRWRQRSVVIERSENLSHTKFIRETRTLILTVNPAVDSFRIRSRNRAVTSRNLR